MNKPPLIIGVNGVAGAGKDTISNMVKFSLEQDHNLKVQCFAFADNLKKAASIIFNVPIDDFFDRNRKEQQIPYWGMSPRQMAQQLGTEACRKGIRDDIWIKSLESSIIHSAVDIAFITDVRFDNEAQFVMNFGAGMTEGCHLTSCSGIVVNIFRNDQVLIKDSAHASENGIDKKYVTHEIENITGNAFHAAAQLQSIILKRIGHGR